MSDQTLSKETMCVDCGGFDIEWMYLCHTHSVEYCRGCECPYCAEEDFDEPIDVDDNEFDGEPRS